MARAGARDPVRLAILLASIAGLIVLGIKTASGTEGASATQRAAARDRSPGKLIAIAARRALPRSVRRQLAEPSTSGVATVRTSRATYLLGGTRRTATGARIPVASVLRAIGHGPAERVAKLPVAVTGACGAVAGDKIFALGGRQSGGRASDLIQEYDVATERSVIAARLPEPVVDTAALSLDGFVYLVGGIVDGSPTRAIVRFDPSRGTAVVAGRLPVPASGAIAAASRRHRGYLVRAEVPGAAPLNFEITVGRHGH
jgi:hypothetical protein